MEQIMEKVNNLYFALMEAKKALEEDVYVLGADKEKLAEKKKKLDKRELLLDSREKGIEAVEDINRARVDIEADQKRIKVAQSALDNAESASREQTERAKISAAKILEDAHSVALKNDKQAKALKDNMNALNKEKAKFNEAVKAFQKV